MSVTKVKLSICGSNYVVSTTDAEEYVNKLAERLDEDMSELMAQNASASVTASAIITALSYLDELNKNTDERISGGCRQGENGSGRSTP